MPGRVRDPQVLDEQLGRRPSGQVDSGGEVPGGRLQQEVRQVAVAWHQIEEHSGAFGQAAVHPASPLVDGGPRAALGGRSGAQAADTEGRLEQGVGCRGEGDPAQVGGVEV
ncbi:hypothetical protein [Streptomyces sp. LN500]|uniref:hypothetical protein n=1 Tax=Streptomyces sp. LN500 TaxID=3112978 RepID=UPI003723216C